MEFLVGLQHWAEKRGTDWGSHGGYLPRPEPEANESVAADQPLVFARRFSAVPMHLSYSTRCTLSWAYGAMFAVAQFQSLWRLSMCFVR